MKKTVLFLGAGMSATFGYPITSQILPRIIEKIKKGSLFNDVITNRDISGLYRKLLKEMLIALSPGIRKVFTDNFKIKDQAGKIPLVTDLLSQLEHLIQTNHAIADWNFEIKDKLLKPGKINDRWDLVNIKTLFDLAIINVINEKEPVYSKEISKFLKWITEQNRKCRQFISIVSTNYDIAFEWEMLSFSHVWNADKNIDFGVSWRDPVLDKSIIYNRPAKPLYRIFKLHGSTDWLKCNRCGFIYINPVTDIYTLSISNSKRYDNTCHCGFWPLQPVLVTMSYIRKMEEPNLSEIWRNCFEELRTANEWIIVGYSLPGEDFDIRSLFLRALSSHEEDLSIQVVQKSNSSKGRYDMFFGEDTYTFFDGGFEEYIPNLISDRKKSPVIKAKN